MEQAIINQKPAYQKKIYSCRDFTCLWHQYSWCLNKLASKAGDFSAFWICGYFSILYCGQLTWVVGDKTCGGGWGWMVDCPSRDLCLAARQLMIYERKDIQTTFWQKRIWRKYDSTRAQVIICDVRVMLHNIIIPFKFCSIWNCWRADEYRLPLILRPHKISLISNYDQLMKLSKFLRQFSGFVQRSSAIFNWWLVTWIIKRFTFQIFCLAYLSKLCSTEVHGCRYSKDSPLL